MEMAVEITGAICPPLPPLFPYQTEAGAGSAVSMHRPGTWAGLGTWKSHKDRRYMGGPGEAAERFQHCFSNYGTHDHKA